MALKTIGVVDVDSRESRVFATSCEFATRRIGGQALLPWVVRRVTDAQRLNQIVVVMSGEDALTIADCVPSDVAVIVCDDQDALRRMLAVANSCQGEAMVRVSIDSPFVDPALIDGLLSAANMQDDLDYMTYGDPAEAQRAGLYAEWCRTEALRQANAEVQRPAADNLSCIYSTQGGFHCRYLPVPERLCQYQLHLRLDGPEEWAQADEIIEALDPEELDWQGIAGLVSHSTSLRRRMAR